MRSRASTKPAPGRDARSEQLGSAVLVATYVLLAKLLLLVFGNHEVVGVLWIAGGPAVAAILVGGPRLLPAVFGGALLGLLVSDAPFAAAASGALRHVAVIGIGAWVVVRTGRPDPALSTLADFLWLLALALGIGVAAGAVTAGENWLGPPFPDGFSFWQRVAGTVLGIVIVTPCILVWRRLPRHWLRQRVALEAMLILGLSFVVGQVVFLDWLHDSLGLVARGYWMFLFVTWAAVRIGTHGAVLVITTVAIQGLVGAQAGTGFFANDIAATNLANYFFYMLILATVGMAVATYFAQKQAAMTELRRYQGDLEDLVGERTARIEALNAELQRRVDEADAANRTKSEFLAKMSHEIRTPLNGILGMAHLLGQSALAPQQRHQLDNITLSGGHLLSVINDILDLSKVEAGKLALARAEFSVADLVGPVLAVTADGIRAKGIALRVDLAALPPRLVGDCGRIGQVLINYLSNAAKFTEAGSITLSAAVEHETDTDARVRFDVADTGVGIAPEQLQHLFVAFAQGDNSATRSFGGTGLGLAINKRLAELMGGTVGVDTVVGNGSRFWVTLPLGKPPTGVPDVVPAAVGTPAGGSLHERCRGVRVLLAEDNVVNQEVALGLLRSVGLVVDLAADGVEAVALAAVGDYAAILMDMQMPRQDGVEATRRIRALPGGREVPVIALTANAYAEDRARCLAAGMSDFVAKPIDPAQLFGVLAKWLPGVTDEAVPAAALPDAFATDSRERRALSRVDGLDVEAGMRCVRNRWPQYRRLLRLFADTHRGAAGILRSALGEDRFDFARLTAHTLKGAAGSIGAQRIRAQAAALERLLERGAPDDRLAAETALGTLDAELQRLVAALEAIDDRGPGVASTAADAPVPVAARD